tara:strand:+ start:456 stop:1292 length:837 start_codon:yes stop_codon:yes gene_type:complete
MKKIKILILLGILSLILIYFSLNIFFDFEQKEDSLNFLCQKEKENNIEEKGFFSDKIKVKKYLSDKYPEIKCAKILYETKDPETLKTFTFPKKFVMKSSSGARMFHLGNENDKIEDLIKKAKYFLSIKFSSYGYRSVPFLELKEPHYDYNDPKIFIEEFIEDIFEFRIMMAKGKIIYCEKIDGSTEVYDYKWEQLKDPIKNYISAPKVKEKPACFEDIVNFCNDFYKEKKFDLMRLDFYITKDQRNFYFGEVTFTPDNCRKKYSEEFNNRYSRIMYKT